MTNQQLRGVVVNVDYCDLARLCLPANLRFLSECWVITSPADIETQEFCSQFPKVRLYITDSFYKDGAFFNKGRCIEECFNVMGRHGNILIHDADILFPDDMLEELPTIQPNILYGAARRIVEDPLQWDPSVPWSHYGRRNDNRRPIGFFQCFSAESALIRDRRPWYDQTFIHAGGGDGFFESLFPRDGHQVILPLDVLHLGPADSNWFGRSTRRLDGTVPERSEELSDLIKRYHKFKGWCGYRPSGEAFREKIESPEVAATSHECR